MQNYQLFSVESLERYELLQAIARGDKITDKKTAAAKYLLTKQGDIQAFLGIHPKGYLIFALSMTKQWLKEIDANFWLYLSIMCNVGWIFLTKSRPY